MNHKQGSGRRGGGLFSRRNFLLLSGGAAAAALLPAAALNAAFAAPAVADAAFHQISQFLTGKTLEPELAMRAWLALNANDSAFAARYAALAAFLGANPAADIDALQKNAEFSGALRQTAQEIISAYYLGYVGKPQSLRAHDDTIFITYSRAIMFQIDDKRRPIPTYSRWDADFWGAPLKRA